MSNAGALARRERSLLCDAFMALGPDAPTLCDGWLTRDLAAHLVVRESRPDAAAGMFIPALTPHLDAVMRRTADSPWLILISRVRSGPSRISPLRYFEGAANLVEFVVHREDVLRAQPTPRIEDRSPAELAVVWQRLRASAPLFFRRDCVTLSCPGFGAWTSRAHPDANARVIVTGSPVDVLLLATGRPHGCVLEGETSAVTAFTARRRGI